MTIRHRSTVVRGAALGAIALALSAIPAFRAGAQTATAASAPTAASDTAIKDLPMSAAERASYVGTYSAESPEGRKMTLVITEEKGTLVGTMNGDEPSRIMSQGKGVIRPERFPDVTVTFTMQGDRATKLTMRQGERVMEMPRVP